MNVEDATPARLLVVDDQPDNRNVLNRFFSRRGFEIVEAADGATALRLIATQSFDAVLLDIVMPGMNGFEVLKAIRLSHSPSNLPVIMVTAKVDTEDVVEALQLGANDYVTKPINFSIANARLQNQLARKQAEHRLADHVQKLEATNHRLEKEIAERKQSEERVRYMAQHDALTGLSNRAHFRDHLIRALGRMDEDGGGLALLFIDLDHFKLINDTLGHRVGDLLLIAIGERLKNAVGKSDSVARLGGDEFAVIHIVKGRPEQAGQLADQIMDALERPYDIEGHRLGLGCSIGIALAPDDSCDPDVLLSNADLALYRAKAEGRGIRRSFLPEMNTRAQARRTLESDLRNALHAGQFELHYQPVCNLLSGCISGLEALLRWRHPERGLIPPVDFIPLAEEIGLITPLGDWVLREACNAARQWPEQVSLAVNLSAVQLRTGNIVQNVVNALAMTGLCPKRLELEITETTLLDDNQNTMHALHQLQSMGTRIVMDDFGTGYSSLSYLRKFPFDKIKIDRSFVRELPADNDGSAIVRSIIHLANNIGMPTTAEGVETEEQRAYLQSEGCSEAQGFLISRPLPSAQLRALFANVAGVRRVA
jgi:diguanylate cyclase (GGDEF)-like protein